MLNTVKVDNPWIMVFVTITLSQITETKLYINCYSEGLKLPAQYEVVFENFLDIVSRNRFWDLYRRPLRKEYSEQMRNILCKACW